MFGSVLILFGLIGSGIMAGIVGKYKVYKKGLVALYIGGVLVSVAFALTLLLENMYVTACVCAVFGFLMVPVLPISYEFGCELTYPVGEAMTGGLLNVGGMLWGIIQIIITSLLLPCPLLANLTAPVLLAVGLLFSTRVKQTLKRELYDHNKVKDGLPPDENAEDEIEAEVEAEQGGGEIDGFSADE